MWGPLTFLLQHFGSIYATFFVFALSLEARVLSAATLSLALTSLIRAISTNPGYVHDLVEAQAEAEIAKEATPLSLPIMRPPVSYLESKRTGARRYCKFCGRLKPDRTHHCKVCRSCVLRMDHHCPWMNTCVGFRNYRFFLLMLWYSNLTLVTAASGLLSIAQQVACTATPMLTRLLLAWAACCLVLDAIPLLMFFAFHAWISSNGSTTIELCEKGMGRDVDYVYSKGTALANWQDIAQTPLEWLLPIRPPSPPSARLLRITDQDRFFSFSESPLAAAGSPSVRRSMVSIPSVAFEAASRSSVARFLTAEWGFTLPRAQDDMTESPAY